MSCEKFWELVKENNGFEFVQAFRDDEDRCIGGRDNKCWYIIKRDGKVKESYVGTLYGDTWKDVYIKGSGKKQTVKEMPAGSTLERIAENAYIYQSEEWVQKRTPKLVEERHPHFHYVKGFGDKALDVSEKYGVSIGYSDVDDVSVGFHLRDLWTGDDVEMP